MDGTRAGAPELRTDRLRLRAWVDDDREPFAALNADPEVTRFLGGPLSRRESDATADRIAAHFGQHGFGLWAAELPGAAPFLGFVGLSIPSFAAHFTPCVEVGWRFARRWWGHGYATEGARAAAGFGFRTLGLAEIVSFTVPANVRSLAVMQRLGMRRAPEDDFEHPLLPPGHRLRRHVLYRLAAPRRR